MKQPDLSKLSPELKAKLEQWEKNSPQSKQLRAVEDMAGMFRDFMKSNKENTDALGKSLEDIGKVLLHNKEQLEAIKDKKFPQPVDNSKGIVDAINKKDFSPTINVDVPEVKVPDVNVPTPETTVNVEPPDTTSFEKVIKKELTKAVKDIVKGFPKVEIPAYPDRWDEVLEILRDIDTGSRLIPQAPTNVQVVNPDGSNLSSAGKLVTEAHDYIDVQQTSSTVETYVYKLGGAGGTTVATVTMTYVDATKKEIDTMVKV